MTQIPNFVLEYDRLSKINVYQYTDYYKAIISRAYDNQDIILNIIPEQFNCFLMDCFKIGYKGISTH